MSLKITGKNPSGKHLELLKQSPNYKKEGFENLTDTPMTLQDTSYYELLKKYFQKNPSGRPAGPLPTIKTDLNNFQSPEPFIVWFGHSSYFIRAQEKNFLIDPVFSGNAAPVSCMVRAFEGADVYQPEDFPEIDYLILTHDHYDHLDYKTIKRLQPKLKRIYCSLGLRSHLEYWGFETASITEMDWWQTSGFDDGIQLTCTPSRHFSGRGLKRFKTLWSSFILKTATHQLYLGGDSGYDSHFKEIGNRFGPFDIAILESGQYNKAWPLIHMMPEQTVQAAVDLGAALLLPVHWSKFMLSMHAWTDPIERVLAEAKKLHVKVATPMIGEPLILNGKHPSKRWWEGL